MKQICYKAMSVFILSCAIAFIGAIVFAGCTGAKASYSVTTSRKSSTQPMEITQGTIASGETAILKVQPAGGVTVNFYGSATLAFGIAIAVVLVVMVYILYRRMSNRNDNYR